MPSPSSPDDRDDGWSRLLDVPLPAVEVPGVPALSDVRAEFDALVSGGPVDPSAVEDALDGL